MPIHRLALATLAGLLSSSIALADTELIRLNQVGYPIGTPKFAVYRGTESNATVVNANSGAFVANVSVGDVASHYYAGKIIDTTCRILDFTGLETPGTYKIKVGSNLSHPFTISKNPLLELNKASIKAFWYNRAGYALTSTYAGSWARAAGHTAKSVIHPSAATAKRPAGTQVATPGGWYDAGDYGRYVVNAGVTMWTLLDNYESHSEYLDTLSLNVPTGATGSDYVNELVWELRWMLSMQDPNDGGVYHKTSSLGFPALSVMPAADTTTQFLVQKSTAATLNLAAVMAQAHRVLKGQSSLKSLTDSCLEASLKAWNWARANPDSNYVQATFNKTWLPKVVTGPYDDVYPADEFTWAASELFLATQADSFAVAESLATKPFVKDKWGSVIKWSIPNWQGVATLGWFSLATHKSLLTGSLAGLGPRFDSMIQVMGDANIAQINDGKNPYRAPLGNFTVGSNSVFANNGIALWKAWQVTGDAKYRDASIEALHFLMGRNLTGYAFVTGFGGKYPVNPHHRPSIGDGVTASVPGFLVGGSYNSDPLSYVDAAANSNTNEVTINWNAPLAYLTSAWGASLPLPPSSSISSRARHGVRTLELNARSGLVSARIPGLVLAKMEVLSIDGRVLGHIGGPAEQLELGIQTKGLVLVRAVGTNGQSLTARALLP